MKLSRIVLGLYCLFVLGMIVFIATRRHPEIHGAPVFCDAPIPQLKR